MLDCRSLEYARCRFPLMCVNHLQFMVTHEHAAANTTCAAKKWKKARDPAYRGLPLSPCATPLKHN